MEKVVKPSVSLIDYNMVKADPENYILLGFSNGKCVCTIYREESWYAQFSADHENGNYDYYDTFEELIDNLHRNYKNFEIMCEKVD